MRSQGTSDIKWMAQSNDLCNLRHYFSKSVIMKTFYPNKTWIRQWMDGSTFYRCNRLDLPLSKSSPRRNWPSLDLPPGRYSLVFSFSGETLYQSIFPHFRIKFPLGGRFSLVFYFPGVVLAYQFPSLGEVLVQDTISPYKNKVGGGFSLKISFLGGSFSLGHNIPSQEEGGGRFQPSLTFPPGEDLYLTLLPLGKSYPSLIFPGGRYVLTLLPLGKFYPSLVFPRGKICTYITSPGEVLSQADISRGGRPIFMGGKLRPSP